MPQIFSRRAAPPRGETPKFPSPRELFSLASLRAARPQFFSLAARSAARPHHPRRRCCDPPSPPPPPSLLTSPSLYRQEDDKRENLALRRTAAIAFVDAVARGEDPKALGARCIGIADSRTADETAIFEQWAERSNLKWTLVKHLRD